MTEVSKTFSGSSILSSPAHEKPESESFPVFLYSDLHINFENIGTANKLNMEECQEGIWEFELELVDFNSILKKGVDRQVQDTCFQIDTIEISPISVKLNYTVNGEVEVLEDETGVPDFGGLVLENGERILMAGSGAIGYTDERKAEAYCICAFNRVVDLDVVC